MVRGWKEIPRISGAPHGAWALTGMETLKKTIISEGFFCLNNASCIFFNFSYFVCSLSPLAGTVYNFCIYS